MFLDIQELRVFNKKIRLDKTDYWKVVSDKKKMAVFGLGLFKKNYS